MELVRIIGTVDGVKKDGTPSGKKVKLGMFLCTHCKCEVERPYSTGLSAIGCSRVCARNISDGPRGSRKGVSNTSYKHGINTGTSSTNKLYKVWTQIKQRCYNPKSAKYVRYGARGISVCEEWHDYANFQQWSITNGYEEGLSIDRVNVEGNYEAGNCEWITPAVNSRKDNYQIRKVAKYSIQDEFIQEYDAIIDAAKDCGNTNISLISKVCKGIRETAYGFKWKYIE